MTRRRDFWLALFLLVLAFGFKAPLTATMALHMLLHIPLILCAGWFMGKALRGKRRASGPIGSAKSGSPYGYNAYGIPGLLLVVLVTAWWMLPRSLDNVLLMPSFDALKFGSTFLAGAVLYDSVARANRVVILFFLGNFCWMTAIVGLIYQENVSRLCNVYLLSDQEQTGRGLVILAVALPVVWIFLARDRVRQYLR